MAVANASKPVLSRVRALRAAVCAAGAVSLLGTSGIQAANVLEEVIVTAQKREQSLQDVGISIASFTGDQMRSFGVVQSFDIASFTPGVHIGGALAGQNTQFSIRGVTQNDFNDVVEAPSAVYLDEGYISASQAQTFAVFDIARVEILKGPQGTLFGRNATGGLVHYISNKPNFDEVEGYVDLTYGRFDTPAHADEKQIQAAIGGPLSENIAGRVAINWHGQEPYLKNLYPYGTLPGYSGGSPGAGAGADMADDETYAGRAILSFRPSDKVEVTLSGNIAESDMSTGPYQSIPVIGIYNGSYADDGSGFCCGGGELINVVRASANETRQSIGADGLDNGRDPADLGVLYNLGPRPVPGGDFFGYIDPDGDDMKTSSDLAFNKAGSMDTWGLAGKIEWQVSDTMTFTSITDYKDYEKLLFIDVDSAPVNQLGNYAQMDSNSFTQELRLNGSTDRSRWVAGVYYLYIDMDSDNGLKAPINSILVPGGLPAPTDIGVDAVLKTKSYSVFGQLEFDLSDTVTAIAGLRVIKEKKDYAMTTGFYRSVSPTKVHQGDYYLVPQDVLPFPIPNAFSDKTSDTLWAGKLQLDWHLSDDMLLYAGVNRGVKAGSFNAPLLGNYIIATLSDPNGLPYDEEVLTSFEGGFKSTIMGGLARLNGSVFYYDYKDYQAFLFTGVGGLVINRDADNMGAELELQASPVDGLDVMLALSWFDAEVKDVPNTLGSDISLDVDPTFAPKFQAAGLIRYEWPALAGTLAIQGDFSYSDKFYYNLRNFDADQFDSYTLFNARFSWTSAEKDWEVALAVRNITDERAGLMGYDLANLCGCNEVSYRAPRWYGANIRYSF